jgi:tetratricopeptide (TPR) repeat protein
MRKISLLIASLFLTLFLGVGALAQDTELPSPGLTPDSPLYFLERISEGIGTFFTFGDLKKAERYAVLATERVAEAQAVVNKGKPEAVQIALKRYEDQLGRALAKAETAKAKGQNIERVTEIVATATSKHLTVLEGVLEKVPEAAKEAITRALEKSKNGHITAIIALAGENPGKAVEINIDSTRGRLEKAKQEAVKKNKAKVEKALEDYEDLQTTLEEVRGKGKTLAALVSEERTKDIKELDEIEDEAKNISTETKNKTEEAKDRAIVEQMSSLRDVTKEDPEKATEINLKAVEARLNRAKAKADEGETDEVEKAVNEFENQYKFGEEISQIAQGLGKDITTVEQLVGKATSIHLEILAEVYAKVPEQAKEAIEKAMTVSVKGHEKAVEALKAKGVLNEVPEEAPVPKELPAQVKERIQKPETPKP